MADKWNNEEVFKKLQETEDPELIKDIKEEIFFKNKGLAVHFATQYYRQGELYDMDDLTQVAFMALWECIDRYQLNHKTKFVTYASYFIKGRIKNFFRDDNWNIYVPKKEKEILQKYNKSCGVLTGKGLDVTRENLMELMHLTEKECEIGESLSKTKYSLAFGNEDDDINEGRYIRNTELTPTTDVTMEEGTLTKLLLSNFLKTLNEEEELIFVEKYIRGLNNNNISMKTKMSYSKIKRIDRDLLRKYKREIESE